MQPSYQSGFYAPGRGVAKHPELWRGCVGAWNPGLGNTGLSLRDWSGNQNNGTLTNGPTWGVTDGRQALTFDGVDDYVAIFNAELFGLGTGNFTASAWVNHSASANYQIILSSWTGDPNGGGHFLFLNTTGFLGAYLGSQFEATSGAIIDGQWTHVAVARNGVIGTFFVRGVNVGSGMIGANNASGGTPKLGTRGQNNNLSQRWVGQIDDTRIYNRALSPQEIRTLAQRPGIAYERAPRKTYFIQAATSTSQFYDVLSPLIFAGTN